MSVPAENIGRVVEITILASTLQTLAGKATILQLQVITTDTGAIAIVLTRMLSATTTIGNEPVPATTMISEAQPILTTTGTFNEDPPAPTITSTINADRSVPNMIDKDLAAQNEGQPVHVIRKRVVPENGLPEEAQHNMSKATVLTKKKI